MQLLILKNAKIKEKTRIRRIGQRT